MPGMDGFSMAEAMEREGRFQATAIIILTSAGLRHDAARRHELRIQAYLSKPIRQADLLKTIKMVLSSAAATERKRAATPHFTHGDQGLRILLAEDNHVNQKLAVQILKKRGHAIVVAETGRQALTLLERQSFDLVLMDVQMPDMDGIEATAAIREREKGATGHVPIIAMTAHAMAGDKQRFLHAGMDGYVSKPIQTKELLQVIDELIRKSKDVSVLEPTTI
jgi:CheY-like chemotaxis protein